MTEIVIATIALAVLVFYLIGVYNHLIEVREAVKKALANIDVLLKQRHEELPKLVGVCKQYMKYEENALTRVIKARQQVDEARQNGDIEGLSTAESALRNSFGQLLALAENYPDLKAESSFHHLSDRISSLQNSISDRREFYNEQATINNVEIEQFPAVIIAKQFGFKAVKLLKFQQSELQDHNLKELFQ